MTGDLKSALDGRIRGDILLPGDTGYDESRALWNGAIDRRPAAIARCVGADDVIAAVDVAVRQGAPICVRGGGHHVAGYAVCDDGLMIDLSRMNDVHVDPARRRARVGPGARVADVDRATQAFGLVTTGAPVPMVGMAGYTLGGGLGWTSRSHGLACDNLVGADVVTAAARLVRASEDENADLFWALRGGSGNFGVVTSFEFRLHRMGPDVLAGVVAHPIAAGGELLADWRDFMRTAPDELQCMPVIFAHAAPDGDVWSGEPIFAHVLLWAGDAARGESAMEPLRRVGTPLSDTVGMVGYAGLLQGLDEMFRAGDRVCYRTAFLDDFSDDAIIEFVRRASPMPTHMSSIFLEPMGGAIARIAPDATAFPHRQRSFCVTAVPKWEDPDRDDEMTAWAETLFEPLAPYAAEGAYVNYLGNAGERRARAAYGGNFERLVEIKRVWDPDNVFRSNHNIPPEG